MFNDYFEVENGASPDPLRKVTHNEILHYTHILLPSMLQDRDRFRGNKEAHILFLLYELNCLVQRIEQSQRAHLTL